jgi:hypothetical protein
VATAVDKSKAVVERQIHTFFDEASPRDQLLFYYSGHGWPGRQEGLYLCVRDTDIDALRPTAVSRAFLDQTIAESPSQRIIIILDCCHSGAFKGTPVTPTSLDGEGRFVITSSGPVDLAADAPSEDRLSPFTELVVEGLQGAAIDEDGDGSVTIDELWRHLKKVAKERALAIPERNYRGATDDLPVAKRTPTAAGRAEHPVREENLLGKALNEVREVLALARQKNESGAANAATKELLATARREAERMPEGESRVFALALVSEEVKRQRTEQQARDRAEEERKARIERERQARDRAEEEQNARIERERRMREATERPLSAFYRQLQGDGNLSTSDDSSDTRARDPRRPPRPRRS